MKKAFLVLLMLLASAASVFASEPLFSDVSEDDWFYAYLQKAVSSGLVEGFSDGSFRPRSKLTCGQFLAMLTRHCPADNQGGWADGYYRKALSQGWFGEDQISIRSLSELLTRKDMALILSGYLTANYPDKTASVKLVKSDYTDISSFDPYEYYISLCTQLGLLQGYSDGSFGRDEYLTRAAAVKVLVLADELGVPEDAAVSDLMPSSKRDLLAEISDSLRFSRDSRGAFFTLRQPLVESDMHIKISCSIYDDKDHGYRSIYSYESDRGWRFHPENYNADAHTISEYTGIDDMSGKIMNFRILLSDAADADEYSSYSVYLDEDGAVRAHLSTSFSGTVAEEDVPVGGGVFGW